MKLVLLATFAFFPVLAFLPVLAFFTVVEDVFAGGRGGLGLGRFGAFSLVVFGRVLMNAPRTSSSDCCALAKNTPEAADNNKTAKMISLDISYLPLTTI